MVQIKNKSEAQQAFAEIQKTWKQIISFFETGEDDSSKPITDRVKNFDDIERISGIKLSKRQDETEDEFAYRQIKLIATVYNEGTELDPMNTSEYKYYPWHKIDKTSGSGLSYHDCELGRAFACRRSPLL